MCTCYLTKTHFNLYQNYYASKLLCILTFQVALKIKQFLATRQLFQKTLDINDVKQRYILVRESTRKDIKEATGAEVQVLGKWVPLREYATEKVPILMLKVTADSADKLDAALRYLDVLMGQAEKMQKLTMQTMVKIALLFKSSKY